MIEAAAEAYNGGATSREVASMLGYSLSGAKFLLRRAGVKFRNPGPRPGAHNPLLKKRKMASNGYVLVWLEENDPYRVMADARGYVSEHRLIMASNLGRPLQSYEHVHHKNGYKVDNRIENLQLVASGHPAGVTLRCRACGSQDIEHGSLAA